MNANNKLALRRQSIRTLSADEMSLAHGGGRPLLSGGNGTGTGGGNGTGTGGGNGTGTGTAHLK
jgi:hypothetical protein